MAVQSVGNRYDVVEKLGEGGMGTVYRGLDRQTGQTVAIKSLKPDVIAHDTTLLERFNREGEALRVLNHPNIVKVLATERQDDGNFLIMEFVAGGSLRDLLDRQPRLPIKRVLAIGLDLADALARAHRLNIIHRDIKPANVLIADDDTPRLTDFGVARIGDAPRVTGTGAFVGTLSYLSPEALSGLSLDERADIWSFGVMLYEMLVGKSPFDEGNLSATITAILTKPAPDLETLRPDAPIALVDLLYRMLEKEVNCRISSVRIVGAELEVLLRNTASTTVPAVGQTPLEGKRFDTTPPKIDALPHNLPAQPTPFVGRQDELAEIARLLNDPNTHLITILGPGGMGKTRLGLESAERIVNTQRAVSHRKYPNGVFFVPLAGLTSSESLAPAIAEALKFNFFGGGEPTAQLIDYLREKRLLLVLDNFEHVIASAGLVADILQAAPKMCFRLAAWNCPTMINKKMRRNMLLSNYSGKARAVCSPILN
jgi:predicted Ser/Thr protein kinase